MSPLTEVEAIKVLEDTLSQVSDPTERDRILSWAWQKYSTKPLPAPTTEPLPAKRTKAKKKASSAKKAKAGAKGHPKPTIVKDLNLKPKGKTPFAEFAKAKLPKTNQEKCTVSVYYLTEELALKAVSPDHVYTCYKDLKWKVPADLYNTLVLTAHRKGWLDTSDMTSIALTTHGENLVEHDLPRPAKGAG
jgi:hypothetical protein